MEDTLDKYFSAFDVQGSAQQLFLRFLREIIPTLSAQHRPPFRKLLLALGTKPRSYGHAYSLNAAVHSNYKKVRNLLTSDLTLYESAQKVLTCLTQTGQTI